MHCPCVGVDKHKKMNTTRATQSAPQPRTYLLMRPYDAIPRYLRAKIHSGRQNPNAPRLERIDCQWALALPYNSAALGMIPRTARSRRHCMMRERRQIQLGHTVLKHLRWWHDDPKNYKSSCTRLGEGVPSVTELVPETLLALHLARNLLELRKRNEERISRPVCRVAGRINPSYLIEVNEGLPNHADGVLEVLLRDDQRRGKANALR
jgi:hypothetical protein